MCTMLDTGIREMLMIALPKLPTKQACEPDHLAVNTLEPNQFYAEAKTRLRESA